MNETIFHSYDVRGTYPDQINEGKTKKIAAAYAKSLFAEDAQGKKIAVGCDVRLSSPSLKKAVIEGLTEAGVDVVDIGTGPTEMVYFAVGSLGLDGGIQVTASHNPAQYNGMKMVGKGVSAISSETGLVDIEKIYLSSDKLVGKNVGVVKEENMIQMYVDFLTKMVDLSTLKPLKIVANNNFGMSGPIAKKVLEKIGAPVTISGLNFEPDGSFPKGSPDPLQTANSEETSALIKSEQANFGVAWDPDGDRFFVLDEHGQTLNGTYITGLIAAHLLKKNPSDKILYEPRVIWVVEDAIKQAGGVPIITKSGHANIKNRMRSERALFGGEQSGHYFYRDFYNADNGILSFLYFLELLGESGKKVSELVQGFRESDFISGEQNFKNIDYPKVIEEIRNTFPGGDTNFIDGLSLTFDTWRCNVRTSNTEPLLRLNIEARSPEVLQQKLAEITEIIKNNPLAS